MYSQTCKWPCWTTKLDLSHHMVDTPTSPTCSWPMSIPWTCPTSMTSSPLAKGVGHGQKNYLHLKMSFWHYKLLSFSCARDLDMFHVAMSFLGQKLPSHFQFSKTNKPLFRLTFHHAIIFSCFNSKVALKTDASPISPPKWRSRELLLAPLDVLWTPLSIHSWHPPRVVIVWPISKKYRFWPSTGIAHPKARVRATKPDS